MSSTIATALVVMLVLLFMKVPVFLSVIAGSAIYFFLNPAVSSMILAQRLVSAIQNPSLMAIPFFVCAGVFMNYSGVTRRVHPGGRRHGGPDAGARNGEKGH